MTDLQKGILTLIRSGLSGQAMALPEGFSIEEAAPVIRSHQITGLCYEGAVLCGIDKTLPIMQEMFTHSYKALMHSEKQLRSLKKLFAAYDANGIDYLPVKGTVLKSLYPRPELRLMGDADVLIRMEQYDKTRPLMESLGYTAQPESHHELPWDLPGLHLELHRYLVPEYHTLEYNFFKDVWQRAVPGKNCRYDLSPVDNYLFTFTHYAKHYRAGGIGIRQLIDVYLLQPTAPEQSLLAPGLSALRLTEFHENTLQMLRVWFDDAQPNDKTDFMTDYIFASGSWGTLQSHRASTGVKAAKETGSKQKARLRLLLDALFPPLERMRHRYPVLEKAPWLLPFLWPVRWVAALLFRRDNIRRYQANIDGASDEKIDSFEKSLHYVGLDFHTDA